MNKTKPLKKTVIIVSAFSTGNKLAPTFIKKGYLCIHVTTKNESKLNFLIRTFIPENFIKNIIIDDTENLIHSLKKCEGYNIKHVLAGSESGAELANRIAQYFDVERNSYEFYKARRNKYYMVKALEDEGLKTPKQMVSAKLAVLSTWYSKHNMPKVIVKPLSSACSDGVAICKSHEEIESNALQILKSKNLYNEANSKVLIQEYIEGKEYIVNAVSCDGFHKITDIWCGKPKYPDVISCDLYADLILPSSSEYVQLVDYCHKALNTLGINFGPTHMELKLTTEGVCIIEVGARLPGRVDFEVLQYILGTNQLEQTVNAYVEKEKFLSEFKTIYPKYHARYVYLESTVMGSIRNTPDLSIFSTLNSLKAFHLIHDGNMIYKTDKKHKQHRPGFAYLVSDSLEQIDEDYTRFKEAEYKLYNQMLGINEEEYV